MNNMHSVAAIFVVAALILLATVLVRAWLARSSIAQRRRGQAEDLSSEQRCRIALQSTGAGVWDLDLRSGSVFYSPRCKEMLGYAEHEVPNTTHAGRRLTHADDLPRAAARMRAYLRGTVDAYECERRMLARDGSWRWMLVRGVAAGRDAHGKPVRLIGTMADITARKHAEEELLALATTDALTGLPNRRHFLSRMENLHALTQRMPEQRVSMLMLDIDHFKRVNDTHGHPAGDAVLRHLAAVMSQMLRKTDIVGRLGGEEFAILLVGADIESAARFAERLRERVRSIALDRPGLKIPYTVSIGVALLDIDDPGIDSTLARADSALYTAKQAGRDRVHLDPASVADAARPRTTPPGFVKLQWREAYDSGCTQIDDQHRGLFETSNRLLNAMMDNQRASDVAALIGDMFEQIQTHFADEERTLAAADYPQLDEHRRLHRELLARAGQLADRHRRDELPIGDLFGFIAHDITARHLLREDRKYFEFLKVRAESLQAQPA